VAYIERCLDSIQAQSYPNIEVICVNDGSTDETGKIIKSYQEKYIKAKRKLIYLQQENLGVAAAVSTGLKVFNGEYMCQIDNDDYYTEDAIEKRVNALESNPEYGILRSDCYQVHEIDGELLILPELDSSRFSEKVFSDWIFEPFLAKKISPYPLLYLHRSSAFLEVNPKRSLYPNRDGQNMQMCLPVIHRFKCLFLDEPQAYKVIRDDSQSRRGGGIMVELERRDCLLMTLWETLIRMNLPEWEIQRYLRMSSHYQSRIEILQKLE